MAADNPDSLDIHLRAYTEGPDNESKRAEYPPRSPGWIPGPNQREVIVVDTKRAIDGRQQLTFGSWRLCRAIEDANGNLVRLACREEGIIYADDLPERD